jgi:hypothetical protein
VQKAVWLVLLVFFTLPQIAAAETFKDAPLVDTNCSPKVADNPDAHTRACALKCAAAGYGIFTPEHKYLKFDAEGNKQITAALKASEKKDHLRVNVEGDVQGDTLKVTSVKLL